MHGDNSSQIYEAKLYKQPATLDFHIHEARGELKVRRVVVCSYHPESFYNLYEIGPAKLHDNIWNLACAAAGHVSIRADLFQSLLVFRRGPSMKTLRHLINDGFLDLGGQSTRLVTFIEHCKWTRGVLTPLANLPMKFRTDSWDGKPFYSLLQEHDKASFARQIRRICGGWGQPPGNDKAAAACGRTRDEWLVELPRVVRAAGAAQNGMTEGPELSRRGRTAGTAQEGMMERE